jgi:hypothetical protein
MRRHPWVCVPSGPPQSDLYAGPRSMAGTRQATRSRSTTERACPCCICQVACAPCPAELALEQPWLPQRAVFYFVFLGDSETTYTTQYQVDLSVCWVQACLISLWPYVCVAIDAMCTLARGLVCVRKPRYRTRGQRGNTGTVTPHTTASTQTTH